MGLYLPSCADLGGKRGGAAGVERGGFKEWFVLAVVDFFCFAAPIFPPWLRLHWRWAMPEPSKPGAMSPVSDRGGSWSALGPWGWLPGKVMSTGYPHRIQTGSQCVSTCLRHCLYTWVPRGSPALDRVVFIVCLSW